MIIRLTTERKNVKRLYEIVGEYFPGFTVYEAIGFWQGKQEKSIVFEIDTMDSGLFLLDRRIKIICQQICAANKQDCVLVQKIESDSSLI